MAFTINIDGNSKEINLFNNIKHYITYIKFK